MPTFIKTGFWEKIQKGYKGWLNLDDLILSVSLPSLNSKLDVTTTAVALVDAATIDLTAIKHTLTTSSATRTFTVSYIGDDIIIEVILNATGSVFTFPAGSLCISEGVASGDNTLTLAGVSGDRYVIGLFKIATTYNVCSKNMGQ